LKPTSASDPRVAPVMQAVPQVGPVLLPLALSLWLAFAGAASAAPSTDTTDAAASAGLVFVHVATPGDTLIGLGRRYLADPARWPDIQRASALRDPRRIPIGRALRIPMELMRVEPEPASVAAASGGVRSGGAPVAVGQALVEGADLVTEPNGHVTVRLVDGTVLRLRSAGRLRIDESRRVPAAAITRSGVRLEQGRVEIEAQPARGGQPGFRISTPQGVLGVRGTSFRVDADATRSRAEVLEGVVVAQGLQAGPSNPERRLAAGYGTVIDAKGQVAPPTALLAAPDLTGLPALHERPLVRLSVPQMPGAASWRVQVGEDDRFDALLADVQSATPELRIAGLADGRYSIRLRAVDSQGLEGRDARAILVLKARPEPPLPSAPAPRAELVGAQVAFAWAASGEAQRYRLQLAQAGDVADPFATPVHDVRDIAVRSLSLDRLPPGRYVWRLASVRANGDQGPFGDAQGFALRALPPPVAPGAPPSVGDNSMRFFWQGLPGQRFDFQLSADPAFNTLLDERQLDVTEIELPLPQATGRFYIRLRSRDADGFVGPWSAPQYVDVIPCVRDSAGACVRVQGGLLQVQ
jgi:hypothetical protein